MAEIEVIRRCKPLLGTFVEITVPGDRAATMASAFDEVALVHALMSFHQESSDLAKLRRAPPGTPVVVDPSTVEVLALAKHLHARTAGAFDVAIGARLVAAGFLPRPANLDLRRMRGTTGDLDILGPMSVVCQRPMLIDLGGIAKGYAVDRAIASLMRSGVELAQVNAGGDLRVIGPARVHLRTATLGVGTAIDIHDCALATSSNLHQRRRMRGRSVSPHLGPTRESVLSDSAVSVIAPTCALADAMTKVALHAPDLAARVLGEAGGRLLPSLPAGLAA